MPASLATSCLALSILSHFGSLPSAIHALFLTLLALVALGLLLRARPGYGWRGWGLPLFFALLFLALLAHQACWQLSGFGSLGFQKFQRRYDPRPATIARTSDLRGALYDRQGELLSQALPGKRWQLEAPLGPAGLHPLGYASRTYGLSGLIRVYDARLCGLPPTTRDDPTALLRRPEPENVHLTLDSRLQRIAYNALKGRRGAVVALDPRSGDILALVSSPAVDPASESALGEATRNRALSPLFNRATQGLYPPGSVFKIFTAALALECGKAGSYACPPAGWAPALSTKPIRDTHPRPREAPMHSRRSAFAESSNIWFAKAAMACTWPRFQAAAHRCGLTEASTLAVCGDRTYATLPGHLPDLSRAPNRVAYLGFGQGDLRLTPMHIAQLTAAIANRGVLVQPHFEAGQPGASRRLWSEAIAAEVATLMRASVLEGTSRAVEFDAKRFPVCGKTGTAETSGRDHAWFTCFAPADKPRIVVTVLIENGGFGAAAALPVAKEILQAAFAQPR